MLLRTSPKLNIKKLYEQGTPKYHLSTTKISQQLHEMRRISQLNRSIDSLRQTPLYTSPSSYIRIACRHRAAFTTSLPRASLADKVQSKLKNSIWRKEDEESNKPDGKEVVQNDSEAKAKAFTETEDILGSYMPAKTWEGLEIVGGKALDWEEKWNYQGFMPDMQLRPTDNDHITTAVHRAVVEVYTLYQAGKPLSICNEPLSVVDLYRDTTSDVQFVETEAGVQLKYTEEQTQSKILKSLESNSEQTEFAPKVSWGSDALESETEFSSTDETATKVAPTESEESVAADRSEVDPSEYDLDGLNEQQADFEGEDEFTLEKHHQSLIAKWDPLWLQVSLEDPQVKFAVCFSPVSIQSCSTKILTL